MSQKKKKIQSPPHHLIQLTWSAPRPIPEYFLRLCSLLRMLQSHWPSWYSSEIPDKLPPLYPRFFLECLPSHICMAHYLTSSNHHWNVTFSMILHSIPGDPKPSFLIIAVTFVILQSVWFIYYMYSCVHMDYTLCIENYTDYNGSYIRIFVYVVHWYSRDP